VSTSQPLGARVLRNTAFLTGGQVVVTGLNILLIPILANALGVEEFGRYGLALSIAALVLVFVDFGSRQLIIRQVGRVEASGSRYCVNGLVVKAVLATVGIGGGVLFASNAYQQGMIRLVLLASVAFSCWAATDFLLALFHSREQMQTAATIQSSQAMLYSIGAIALVIFTRARAGGVLVWQLLCFGLMAIFAYRIAARDFRIHWGDVNLRFMRGYLQELWVFALLFIASQGVVQLPPIILSVLAADSNVGVYQGAARVILAIEVLPRLLSSGIYPVLAKMAPGEDAKWRRLSDTWLRYSTLAGAWLGCILALVGGEISSFLFRVEGYQPVANNLRVLSLLVFSRFIAFPVGVMLLSLNREKWCAAVMVPATLVSAGLAGILVGHYGTLGATLSWVAAGIFVAAGFIVAGHKEMRWLFRSKRVRRTMVAVAGVLVVVPICLSASLGMRLACAALLTPALAVALRAVTYDDLRALRNGFLHLSRRESTNHGVPG